MGCQGGESLFVHRSPVNAHGEVPADTGDCPLTPAADLLCAGLIPGG